MIRLNNISLDYDERHILKNVSLTVEKGTTSVILGSSGAGKSTILKVILGLTDIKSGEVFINGKSIYQINEKELLKVRRKIGIVFQGNALFDSLNVRENVSYFLAYENKLSEREINEKVKEMLSFVNLEDTQELYPDQLSGGMKKRIAIARALAAGPEIILFDEPTTGLDPINSKAILELINKLKSLGKTSIVVTHILNDAVFIADNMTVINEGEIFASGSVREILKSDNSFIQKFFYEIFLDNTLFKEN
jgi:phospholipid/cholesterol/gamma-HCH transport system ATP-binding protein